jgi:hypothetical protein
MVIDSTMTEGNAVDSRTTMTMKLSAVVTAMMSSLY